MIFKCIFTLSVFCFFSFSSIDLPNFLMPFLLFCFIPIYISIQRPLFSSVELLTDNKEAGGWVTLTLPFFLGIDHYPIISIAYLFFLCGQRNL